MRRVTKRLASAQKRGLSAVFGFAGDEKDRQNAMTQKVNLSVLVGVAVLLRDCAGWSVTVRWECLVGVSSTWQARLIRLPRGEKLFDVALTVLGSIKKNEILCHTKKIRQERNHQNALIIPTPTQLSLLIREVSYVDMPKKKGGGKGSGASASSSALPVCNCQDPYKCECGHRPERPSRGHKWDPVAKQWGGKGHKQKGAALGQAATVAKDKVITTQVGKTTLAPHQRLPSTILREYCQKQKRKPPIYREIKGQGKQSSTIETFQYRLILPETAASKDDLHFVPAEAVGNAEQAKEEAALLALLYFTPTLPHERKLPEPYKTTWLQALEAQKQAKKTVANNKKQPPPESTAAATATTISRPSADCSGDGGAKATTGLRSAVAVNKAAKEEERNEKRRVRNAKIQKHEAIRLANQPHPVFMSAKLRQAIERILRHEKVKQDDDDDTEEEEAFYENSMESEVQEYVEDRLHKEGFTRKQARDAFQKLSSSSSSIENDWEKLYEEALQWLLVHVDEEDLPASFDPRGGTLDVISAKSRGGGGSNGTIDPATKAFADRHGLAVQDAHLVCGDNENGDAAQVLWQTACRLANASPPPHDNADHVEEGVVNDELEALEAIFVEECEVSRPEDNIIVVKLPLDGIHILTVTLHDMMYPQTWPKQIAVESDKPWANGLSLLVETAKFLSSDAVMGEPMIFSIHGHLNELLQMLDELPHVALAKPTTTAAPTQRESKPVSTSKPAPSASVPILTAPPVRKRPREKSPFWSIPPAQTPPAVPFPPGALKRARSVLPAAGARADFLKALKKADKGSHVVLCTGETGCGKSTVSC